MRFKMVHENYNVQDLDASLAFYEKALGLTENSRKTAEDGSYIIVYIGNDEADFELELTWLAGHPGKYDIGEEEFLPAKDQLLVTLHPGFFNKRSAWLPYDRNPRSSAYVSFYSPKAKSYFCGGLNGGGTVRYLKLIRDLDRQICEDDRKDVVALWHDESHLNRYMLTQKNYKVLSPSYAYPEDWDMPFEPKLLLLGKRKIWDLKDRQPDMTGQKRMNGLRKYLTFPLDYFKCR